MRAGPAEIDFCWCTFAIFQKSAPTARASDQMKSIFVGALQPLFPDPHQLLLPLSYHSHAPLVRFYQIAMIRTNIKRAGSDEIDLCWCAFAIFYKSAPISTSQKLIQPRQIGALS
jgi:hypothetical protein